MGDVINCYRGQYKASKKMDASFDALWTNAGFESGNDSVKLAMEMIFKVLDKDIKK
jgi:uncharacterized protein VirK/YbjX